MIKRSDKGFILPIVLVMSSFISFALAYDLQNYVHELRLIQFNNARTQLLNTMEVAVYDALQNYSEFEQIPAQLNYSFQETQLHIELSRLDSPPENDQQQFKIKGQWSSHADDVLPYSWERRILIEKVQGSGLLIRGISR